VIWDASAWLITLLVVVVGILLVEFIGYVFAAMVFTGGGDD
jgi:uncharacterized membrane protein